MRFQHQWHSHTPQVKCFAPFQHTLQGCRCCSKYKFDNKWTYKDSREIPVIQVFRIRAVTSSRVIVAGRRPRTPGVRKLIVETPENKYLIKDGNDLCHCSGQAIWQTILGWDQLAQTVKSRVGSTMSSAVVGHFIRRWALFDGFQHSSSPTHCHVHWEKTVCWIYSISFCQVVAWNKIICVRIHFISRRQYYLQYVFRFRCFYFTQPLDQAKWSKFKTPFFFGVP